jgi:16S rRNA (uracil1498-N3)-methyltransferase
MPLQAAFGLPMMKTATKAGVLVGPEGGFTAEEFDAVKEVPGAVFVRLGPRILRADTAAIAALSCWQGMRGDWV